MNLTQVQRAEEESLALTGGAVGPIGPSFLPLTLVCISSVSNPNQDHIGEESVRSIVPA